MVPFYAARVSDLGPGDFVQVECACGHTERLTAPMLSTAGVTQDERVQGLGSRMRCRDCDTKEGSLDRIDRDIQLSGPLTAEQKQRLLEIADKCPIHRTLTSEVDIRTIEQSEGEAIA